MASRYPALAAVLLCAAALRGDLLVLEDGSRVSGTLRVCDEETCSIGKQRIPLSRIAQIVLGDNAKPSMARRTANILMTDGTLRTGQFTGLNLGFVFAGEEEIERDRVAVIFPGEKRISADLLITPDGTIRTGTLTGCNAASCTLEGELVASAGIQWIGLGQEGETPPSATGDAVYFAAGEPVAARLSAIDAVHVQTTRGTFPRANVTWIHLAAPQEPAPPPGGGVPNNETAPPPAPPPPPAAPPQQQPPGAPPPPNNAPAWPPVSTLPSEVRGPLWTGTMDSRLWGTRNDIFSETQVHVDVRLREYIVPMVDPAARNLKQVGTSSRFGSEGSVVRESARCSGSGITCSGQGSITITGGPDEVGGGTTILRRTASESALPFYGVEIPQGKALYWLCIAPADNPHYDITYRAMETSVQPQGFSPPCAGRVPIVPPSEISDLEYRYLEGGIMRGSFSRTLSDGMQYSVTWSVCPEGAACPPAPPLPGDDPPESTDPCDRSGQQEALRDTCRAQLDSMLDSLAPALAEYNALMASAEANREAFQDAQAYCALYDSAKEVLEAILSGGAGPAAEAARALVYLRDVIAKVQSGDLASMLYPSEVQKFLGYYGKAKEVWFELTADDVSKMRRDLGACSGKMPADTFLGAQKFVEDLAAAKRVWNDRVAPGMNDLRSKGLECANAGHAAWRACLEDAECRGIPPDCGPEPSLEGSYDP